MLSVLCVQLLLIWFHKTSTSVFALPGTAEGSNVKKRNDLIRLKSIACHRRNSFDKFRLISQSLDTEFKFKAEINWNLSTIIMNCALGLIENPSNRVDKVVVKSRFQKFVKCQRGFSLSSPCKSLLHNNTSPTT